MIKKYTVLYLSLLTVLAITTRFILLEKSPPGFYVDEASFGYNAVSVMKAGYDIFMSLKVLQKRLRPIVISSLPEMKKYRKISEK